MTLIIEDGTNPAGANTFIDVQFVRDYTDARGIDLSMHDDTKIAQALIVATDALAARKYLGEKTSITQRLPFPRKGMVLQTGEIYPDNAIPYEVLQAQAVLAKMHLQGIDLLPNKDPNAGQVIEKTVHGAITKRIQYGTLESSGVNNGGKDMLPTNPTIDQLLSYYSPHFGHSVQYIDRA